MQIYKKIDNIVKKISKTTPSGHKFFDNIDSEIKNPENTYIILELFQKLYDDFGFNYNLVVSGGFADIVSNLIDEKKITCKGSILYVSGSLTSHLNNMNKISKNKDVIIKKHKGNIDDKEFIFVDDSYYSGTTMNLINEFLKIKNSKIIKTYVVYNGNDKKTSDIISLYNYYDYNRGSNRTFDELYNELDKYNVPKNIFIKKIKNKEIISIIELRKSINEYNIKNGLPEIDIHNRIRENIHIFNYSNFLINKNNI